MSFAVEKSKIKLPPRAFTIGLIVLTLVIGFTAVYFDESRSAAFFTVPVIALLAWCAAADIKYATTPRIKVCVWVFCVVFLLGGNVAMFQIASIENGSLLINKGLIYDASLFLAHKQPE